MHLRPARSVNVALNWQTLLSGFSPEDNRLNIIVGLYLLGAVVLLSLKGNFGLHAVL